MSRQNFIKRSIKFVAPFDATVCRKFAASRQTHDKCFLRVASNLPHGLPRLWCFFTAKFDGTFAMKFDASIVGNIFELFAIDFTAPLPQNLTVGLTRILPRICRTGRRYYCREFSCACWRAAGYLGWPLFGTIVDGDVDGTSAGHFDGKLDASFDARLLWVVDPMLDGHVDATWPFIFTTFCRTFDA